MKGSAARRAKGERQVPRLYTTFNPPTGKNVRVTAGNVASLSHCNPELARISHGV